MSASYLELLTIVEGNDAAEEERGPRRFSHNANYYRLVVAFLVCFTVACDQDDQDVVKLTGGSGNYPAIVLMDYIEPGKVCPAGRFNDKILEVKNTLKFGKASAGCDPQVSVFVFENSMSYETNVTWTDGRDTHTVNLQPLNVVPVSVWLARPKARNNAKDYVGKADEL